MQKNFDLTGKVALVTGAQGGLGKAIALGMAKAGANIVVANRNMEALKPVVKEIEALGRKALATIADVTNEEQVNGMVENILNTFPRIDILVNGAGWKMIKPAETYPIDEWRKVIDNNNQGTFLCCQAVGRVMVRQKNGHIINLSSVRARYGLPPGYAAAFASKGAVDSLTRTLAREWAKYNVLVNALAPTVVETDMMREALRDPVYAKQMKSWIPMGRWALTEEIVGFAIFFASDTSQFVTGRILYID